MAGPPRTPTNGRHDEDHHLYQVHASRKAGRHPNRYATLVPTLRVHFEDSESSDVEMEPHPWDSVTDISSPSSLFSGTTFSTVAEEDENRTESPPLIHSLFEELSQTWQFVVACPITRHAVIVDPQLDNAPAATTISTIAADRVLAVIQQNHYIVDRILHTHEPREHPSSCWYLRAQLLRSTGRAPKITIGKTISAFQRMLKRKYNMSSGDRNASNNDSEDTSLSDGQTFPIGNLRATVLQFPGGNGVYAFVVGQHIFSGASIYDLELRARNNILIHDLRSFQIYTINDAPPQRKVRLVPMFERERRAGKPDVGKKLVIRYDADDGPENVAELE